MAKVLILLLTLIAVLASKGGVGKSTLSILLYEALRKAGKSVAIRDWDLQGTSNKALRLIQGEQATLTTTYDVVIYDTPPRLDHSATLGAVKNADITLVVTSPSPADTWEAEEAVQFARSKNDKTTVRLVFNKVRKGTVLGRLVDESAKRMSVPTLKPMLSYRECYQHAIGQGWKALDGAAREEVLAFALAVMALTKKIIT